MVSFLWLSEIRTPCARTKKAAEQRCSAARNEEVPWRKGSRPFVVDRRRALADLADLSSGRLCAIDAELERRAVREGRRALRDLHFDLRAEGERPHRARRCRRDGDDDVG